MPDEDVSRDFPDVSHKLAAPKKLTTWEKDKQTAEAKKKRDDHEMLIALQKFESEFGDDADAAQAHGSYGSHGEPASRFEGRFGRSDPGPRSGPGSLGPVPGPPKKRRALDEMREQQAYGTGQYSNFGADAPASRQRSYHDRAHDPDEDDDEVSAPKPTLFLTSLPPIFVEKDVKRILRDHVKVLSVQIIGASDPDVQAVSAIATLHPDTVPKKLDTTVTALRDKYVGFGYFLSISRHLSSQTAAMHPAITSTQKSTLPYNATKRPEAVASLRKAPPPMQYKTVAPPSADSFHDYQARPAAEAVVNVCAPPEMAVIRMIHTIANRLLAEPNPIRAMEIEALLMSKKRVQYDERFAFLFDSSSPAGVYYRYLLWNPDHLETGNDDRPYRIDGSYDFEWTCPREQFPFTDLTDLTSVLNHIDYRSSDEESDDNEHEPVHERHRLAPDDTFSAGPNKNRMLTPLQLARLTSMLADLPKRRARLRKADVTAVTYFAIQHAGQGAEEIVNTLLLNVLSPFNDATAAKYMGIDAENDGDDHEPDERLHTSDPDADTTARNVKRDDDPSDARLIGLFLITDILSAASTAGAKNAWKYRQLFETGFQAHRTFEHLGRLDKELGMGRIKAMQWTKRIESVFSLWKRTNAFSLEGQEALEQQFASPSPVEQELCVQEMLTRKTPKELPSTATTKSSGPVWKSSHGKAATPQIKAGTISSEHTSKEGLVEDIDGTPMDDEDIDGIPMDDEEEDDQDTKSTPVDVGPQANQEPPVVPPDDPIKSEPAAHSDKIGFSVSRSQKGSGNAANQAPRRRMRAEDMFADSDDE